MAPDYTFERTFEVNADTAASLEVGTAGLWTAAYGVHATR